MNHDKLRQQAEATLSNGGSPREYILAEAVLALLDENAALRAAVKEIVEYSDPLSRARLLATRALAIGDAS